MFIVLKKNVSLKTTLWQCRTNVRTVSAILSESTDIRESGLLVNGGISEGPLFVQPIIWLETMVRRITSSE